MDLRIIFGIAFFVLIVSSMLFFIFLEDASHPLIIHFDTYRGIDLWGGRGDVLNIILLGFIMNGVNGILAIALRGRAIFPNLSNPNEPRIQNSKLIPGVLGGVSVFTSLLILIAVGVIISVN